MREDVATIESWGNPVSTRAAVEEMPEGSVVVADAMGAIGKPKREIYIPVPDEPAVPELVPMPERSPEPVPAGPHPEGGR